MIPQIVNIENVNAPLRVLCPSEVDTIVIHCSDTSANNELSITDIDSWHRARGWKCCGYHYVIKVDGTLQRGRQLNQRGAHAIDYNKRSIGICYIGGRASDGSYSDTRTWPQKISICYAITEILRKYPGIKQIIGHNDISAKACPCFDAKKEYSNFISKFNSYAYIK